MKHIHYKSKKYFQFILNIVLVLFIISFYSCENKKTNTIKIGVLDGPSAVSFIKLIETQTYVDSKRIEIIVKSDPLQIQALMIRNEIDFAILPTIMAANLYNKGLKYKMAACPIWGTLYLLTNNKSVNINNLNNHKISVFGKASTSDILLKRYLTQREVKNTVIDYTYTTNHELARALRMKMVEIAVVSEPMVSILTAQDSTIKIVSKLECEDFISNYNKDIFVQTAFLVSDKFADDYPFMVSKVCESYSNSCNFINEQPEEAAKLMLKHGFAPSIEIAKRSLALCNIQYVAAFAIEQELSKYLNVFYQFNPISIGGNMPDKNFIFHAY